MCETIEYAEGDNVPRYCIRENVKTVFTVKSRANSVSVLFKTSEAERWICFPRMFFEYD